MTDEILQRFNCNSRAARNAFAHTTREVFLTTLRQLDISSRSRNEALKTLPLTGEGCVPELAIIPDETLRRYPHRVKPDAIRVANLTLTAILENRSEKKRR